MGSTASKITHLTIVYSTIQSCADQRKHEILRHWPLWREFTGDQWIPRTKANDAEFFAFEDVIMLNSTIQEVWLFSLLAHLRNIWSGRFYVNFSIYQRNIIFRLNVLRLALNRFYGL